MALKDSFMSEAEKAGKYQIMKKLAEDMNHVKQMEDFYEDIKLTNLMIK